MPAETAKFALQALKSQRRRSFLNLLSIIIGMAAIVSLIAIGQGLNAGVSKQIEMLGTKTIFVEPGNLQNPASMAFSRIDESDIKEIERLQGVESVIGFYEAGGVLAKGKETVSAFFIGIEPEKQHFLAETGYLELVDGRFLEQGDTRAILVDEDFVEKAFQKEVGLRQGVETKGKEFKIVGVVKKNSMSAMGGMNLVWAPKETVKEVFSEGNPTELAVVLFNENQAEDIAKKIEERLEMVHGEKKVSVLTPKNILEQTAGIIGTIQLVLLAIAAISLIVGAIGITNTMIVNVLQRTREIGLMKAVGATESQVLFIFAFEAVLLGAIGGFFGTILGYVFAFGAGAIISSTGFLFPIIFDPVLFAEAVAFAGLVGGIAGIAPAQRAARLDPTEALRWE